MDINYKEIITSLDNIGSRLSGELNLKEDKRLIVAFDILKKIKNNLFALSKLPDEKMIITSKNLIYRTVFSDLLTLLFLLHISKDEFEYSIKILDIKHVKYMKEVLPMRLKLGKQLFNPKEEEKLCEQEYTDRFYDCFKEYLTNNKGESWSIITYKSLDKPSTKLKFKGEIKSIYEYLKDCRNNNLKALANLYMYYKYLSQTEHYSYVGRHYSFTGQSDKKWIKELNASIKAGGIEIENLLKPLLEPNTLSLG